MQKETLFYNLLNDVFTGVKTEGRGGYINLLKIKCHYYELVLKQFKDEVDNHVDVLYGEFKEEFFNKLYNFFERYFSESGSVYFCRTAYGQKVYEQVYTDNKDVMLFWKTHMLYYVKSERLFRDMELPIRDGRKTHHFAFDVSALEHQKSNEKKALIYTLLDTERSNNKTVHRLQVTRSKNGSKTKLDAIAKQADVKTDLVANAIKYFERQTEVDYFINKNPKQFLTEQLNLYLHQYLLHEENEFDQHRLVQIKAFQDYALKLINFIAQFEGELVKIWEKPKFATNSNYVVTLDNLDQTLISKITKHANFKAQVAEWKALQIVDAGFKKSDMALEKYRHLPIDTKHFKDLELEVLGLFDDLDSALDGRLIRSENWQALNTIKHKYKNNVQCIYIDPPFNLASGGDFDYKVNYRDANWATMLENRIKLAKGLLDNKGSIFVRCDHNGNFIVRCLLDELLGKDNFRNEIIVNRTQEFFKSPGKNPKKYMWDIDSLFLFSATQDNFFNQILVRRSEQVWWEPFLPSRNASADDFRMVFGEKIYPPAGRQWGIDQETIDELEKQGRIRKKETGKLEYSPEFKKVKNNWTDIPGYAKTQGFPTENSEVLLERVIQTASQGDGLVLDFFMGSGTTQAVAHKLGRKWLGVEMGEQFEAVVLPRMKRVLAGSAGGVTQSTNGISQDSASMQQFKKGGFFKYYSLEQYEDALKNIQYKDYPNSNLFTADKQTFDQYVFFADKKLSEVMAVRGKAKAVNLNFEKLYRDIDLAETLANLYGAAIVQVTQDAVTLRTKKDTFSININPASNEEKMELIWKLKPLLWWGEE